MTCETCEGHRHLGEFEHVDPYTGEHLGNELIPCPDCHDREAVAFTPDRFWTNTADNVVSFQVNDPPWGVGGKLGNTISGPVRVYVVSVKE